MSKSLNRSAEKSDYKKIAQKWKQDKKMAGSQTGFRNQSFHEWLESREEKPYEEQPVFISQEPYQYEWAPQVEQIAEEESGRGVLTINIAGNEDE